MHVLRGWFLARMAPTLQQLSPCSSVSPASVLEDVSPQSLTFWKMGTSTAGMRKAPQSHVIGIAPRSQWFPRQHRLCTFMLGSSSCSTDVTDIDTDVIQ